MTRSDAERVHDILDACNKLVEIAALGRAEFDRSWILQSAAERQLEIIGEAIVWHSSRHDRVLRPLGSADDEQQPREPASRAVRIAHVGRSP
ncbi:HepT-like ribonuclease domain-containing protein [Candidatus Poriferisodalis sp.]